MLQLSVTYCARKKRKALKNSRKVSKISRNTNSSNRMDSPKVLFAICFFLHIWFKYQNITVCRKLVRKMSFRVQNLKKIGTRMPKHKTSSVKVPSYLPNGREHFLRKTYDFWLIFECVNSSFKIKKQIQAYTFCGWWVDT